MGFGMNGPGADTYGLSDVLWNGMIREKLFGSTADPTYGFGFFDNFTNFGGALTSTAGLYFSEGNRYAGYQTASTFIVPVAESAAPTTTAPVHRGAIAIYGASGVTDNDIMSMQLGYQAATPYGTYPFAVLPGISNDLAFECRIKVSSVAASIGDFFVGLAGGAGVDTVTAVLPLLDNDTMGATYSHIGFNRLAAETTPAYLSYNRSGGTVSRTRQAATLVADTYVKLGFRWDSKNLLLRTYCDGTEVSGIRIKSNVTGTSGAGTTPWPNDYMAPLVSVKQIDGTTLFTFTMDWWACAQLR
jgi:hypothetical protein